MMPENTMPETTTAELTVRDLRVTFGSAQGEVHAVNGVSFSVRPGEMLGIVGESGCGKSATLRAIAGLTPAPGKVAGGRVEFAGEDLTTVSRRRLRAILGSGIGFISQSPFGALNPILSIEKQFRNCIRAHSPASSGKCREIALAALNSVGIAGPERVLDGYAHQLSGGMAQRVVIAMATVHRPRIILADEPTTALDVTVQREILDLFASMLASSQRSLVLVTHDLSVVAQYCSRVLVMYAGKVVEEGPVRQVFDRPAHPYTRALLDAVPRVGAPIRGLRGGLPDLIDYPAGCPYVDRCASAGPECGELEPPPRDFTADRRIACHHPVEEVVSGAAARS
ncbi:ABC transporter ATP-binding protein [Amycolatopsis jejuensis]|uniref:ABC transporter ATP-binding protein n=1 Tax=Amycolatopsis jejuensis TaxID=330084 RepID=UPI000690A1BF|nr:ABC transporter ATP-binding protein [Amycolatopsis jejuensis]